MEAARSPGLVADAGIEAKLSGWKRAHITSEVAKLDVELARSIVRKVFEEHDCDFIESSLGTIPIQRRGGSPTTDWQAVAREGVTPKKLEKLIAKHTKIGAAPGLVVAAPQGWGVEAKAGRCEACRAVAITGQGSCVEHG